MKNGNKSLETYAVLDDGSEWTILLQSAAKQLGIKGCKEMLALCTVRQEVKKLHGAAISFTISPQPFLTRSTVSRMSLQLSN